MYDQYILYIARKFGNNTKMLLGFKIVDPTPAEPRGAQLKHECAVRYQTGDDMWLLFVYSPYGVLEESNYVRGRAVPDVAYKNVFPF